MRLLRELQVEKDLQVIDVVESYRRLGWTYREIAAELGIGLNTLYLNYRRAIQRKNRQKDVYEQAVKDRENAKQSV